MTSPENRNLYNTRLQERLHSNSNSTMNPNQITSNTWMSVTPFNARESFQTWFSTFDLHVQFDGLDEQRKLIALQLKGGEPVRRHIEEMPEGRRTYSLIITSLIKTFTGAISVEAASSQLVSYRFNYSDFRNSLNNYVALIDQANPSTRRENFRSLVEERLINNLREGLARYLRNQRRHYGTLEEMIEDLILENDLQQNHHKKKKGRFTYHSDNVINYSRNTDRCRIHQNSNHTNAECRKQKPTTEPLPKNETSYINSNLIQMPATINNRKCQVLIDSGATCTLVSPSFAKSLKVDFNTSPSYLTTAGSPSFAKQIHAPLNLRISDCSYQTNMDNYIAPHDFNGYHVILGMNYLVPLRCSISTHDKKAYFCQPPTSNFLLSPQEESLKEEEDKFRQLIQENYGSVDPQGDYDVGPGLFTTPPQEFFTIPPIGIKHYSSPPSEDDDHIIQQMLNHGIIEESTSLMTLPYYLLIKRDEKGKPQKQNGKIRKRFILDCREINHKTRVVPFHCLSLQILLQQLKEFDFGSTIDLHQGYFQMLLNEADRPLFSFKYRYQVYQFKRAPMGAKNSPSFFQNNMEILLANIRKQYQSHTNIFIYMDDILILTKGTAALHLQVVETIIKEIHSKQGKISLTKCCFLRTSLSFLSWTFSKNTITPTISQLIQNSTLPQIKKELYSKLQCFNYFRLSIPNFHERTRNLYQLTKGPKNEKIKWTKELSDKYYSFCKYIFNKPMIYMYDENQPLILKVDGSNSGIGGFLCQRDVEGIIRPLGFFSYPLQETKNPRSPTYIELLAIARGISTFRYLIQGKELIVESDHRPLSGLIKQSTTPKFAELISSIAQYTTNIKYINGSNNQLADLLSRIFNNIKSEMNQVEQPKKRGRPKKLLNPMCQDDKYYINYELLPIDLASLQKMDEELTSSLQDGKYNNLQIEKVNDIIVTKDTKVPIITDEETIQTIFKICHDQSGHWNAIATKEIIQKYVYIPNLEMKIKDYISKCDTCNRFNSKNYEKAKSVEQIYNTFECLAADAMGPLEITKNKSMHILLYVCPASKFVIAHAMPDLTSKSIINSLQQIKASYTLPRILRTDSARYWTAKEVENYLQANQVFHSLSTPTNSTGNAFAERFIRTLQTILGKLLLDYPSTQWDQILPEAIYSMNHFPRNGSTPFQQVLKFAPSTVLQLAMQKSLTQKELQNIKQKIKATESAAYAKVRRRTKLQPRYEEKAVVDGVSRDGKTLHLLREGRNYLRPKRNTKIISQ